MNKRLNNKFIIYITFTLSIIHLSLLSPVFAEKIYLDITQPGIKKLTIALEGFEKVPVVCSTIKEDLEFTEYFRVYGPFPYKGEKFEPSLWKASDVEIVVRGDTGAKISIKIFTVTTDAPIFIKEYHLQNNEYTGHLISSDLYKFLTGRDSPFFNRFVFLRKFKNSTGIFVSNWNGKNIHDTGIRREIISRAVLKGNKIFYSSLQSRLWHIEVFDLSTKTNREIIKSWALLQLGDIINDSQFIYLENDGELSEIKISNLSGKTKTISSSRWIDSSPRYSYSQIFFVSNRAGSPQIYQMREGTGTRRITFQGRYNTEPALSPDGGKLAFSSLTAEFQIYIFDLISGTQTQVTKEGNNEQPSFCPDGHFLTIMSDRRGKKEVFLISSDGVVQKPLTQGYLPHCSR
uniref:TolB protein n=1 Tax=Thermodesulfovibrio aggregans TaxID=86166 RepID=A0A7C4AJC2_9BACT